MRPKCKILDSRDQNPGPGAYKFFSEFGIYEKEEKKDNNKNYIFSIYLSKTKKYFKF